MRDALKSWLAKLTSLPVRFDEKPDTPDALLVVTEYGGSPIRNIGKTDRDLQLLFRGKTAHDDAWRVYRAMDPSATFSYAGGGYIVRPKQSPFFFENDILDRTSYVLNVAIIAAAD